MLPHCSASAWDSASNKPKPVGPAGLCSFVGDPCFLLLPSHLRPVRCALSQTQLSNDCGVLIKPRRAGAAWMFSSVIRNPALQPARVTFRWHKADVRRNYWNCFAGLGRNQFDHSIVCPHVASFELWSHHCITKQTQTYSVCPVPSCLSCFIFDRRSIQADVLYRGMPCMPLKLSTVVSKLSRD